MEPQQISPALVEGTFILKLCHKKVHLLTRYNGAHLVSKQWKQSKWYHLYVIVFWPINAFLTETKFGFTDFAARLVQVQYHRAHNPYQEAQPPHARFRRDILNPDLAQAANAPWPANAADNIWTHSIHAIASKVQRPQIYPGLKAVKCHHISIDA